MTALLGYARVSTADQDLEGQRRRLHEAGVLREFEDVISGTTFERPGLQALFDFARGGDALCVVRPDRLGRSLHELLETVDQLKARGIGLVSIEEKIDTSSAAGELAFHVFGAHGRRTCIPPSGFGAEALQLRQDLLSLLERQADLFSRQTNDAPLEARHFDGFDLPQPLLASSLIRHSTRTKNRSKSREIVAVWPECCKAHARSINCRSGGHEGGRLLVLGQHEINRGRPDREIDWYFSFSLRPQSGSKFEHLETAI
jgi:hypothetical protein